MDIDKVKKYIDKGYSTYQLAEVFGKSQTTIRYWLRKFGLNTNLTKCINKNGKSCCICGGHLKGKQLKFCSSSCKAKATNNTNTYDRQCRVAKERKLKLIELSGGSCVKCGYCKNYASLEFHHKDPSNKTFNLDSRKLSNTNWDSILLEHSKCELLCSNCHREHHNPECFI